MKRAQQIRLDERCVVTSEAVFFENHNIKLDIQHCFSCCCSEFFRLNLKFKDI